MDLEMTGIEFDQAQQKDDLPSQRYQYFRQVATNYNIIQVGFCIFLDNEQGGYTPYPYNVYVYPKSNPIYNPQIKFQLTTIEFNTKNNMDYNKWIKEGVSYIQEVHYEDLKKSILKIDQKSNEENLAQKIFQNIQQNQKDKLLAEKQILDEWYSDVLQTQDLVISNLRKYPKEYLLQYQKENLPLCQTSLKQDANYINTITFQKYSQQELKTQLEEIYGFTDIMKTIYEGQVPIITHNGLNDHLFMYNTFKGPLPENYEEFKLSLKNKFPPVYDTKQIFTIFNEKFFKSTLEFVKDYILNKKFKFQQKIKITWPKEQQYREYDFTQQYNLQRLHEARYDAFITGWVYIQLLDSIGQQKIDRFKNQFIIFNNNFIMNFQGEDIVTNDH